MQFKSLKNGPILDGSKEKIYIPMHSSDYIYPCPCVPLLVWSETWLLVILTINYRLPCTVYHTYLPGGGAVLQGHVALYTHHNVQNICLPERDNYAGNPYSNYIIVTLSNGYRHNIIIN